MSGDAERSVRFSPVGIDPETAADQPDGPSRQLPQYPSNVSVTNHQLPRTRSHMSPEAYYENESVHHYSDYPVSAKQRTHIENEITQSRMSQMPREDVNPLDNVDADSVMYEQSLTDSERQQRMLNEGFASQSRLPGLSPTASSSALGAGAGAIHLDNNPNVAHTHATFELEDEEEVAPKFPLRTAVVAVFLLLVGVTCLIIGIVHFATGSSNIFAFVLIGAILIIPGGYQSYILYNAWRRVPGFSFSQLSAYE